MPSNRRSCSHAPPSSRPPSWGALMVVYRVHERLIEEEGGDDGARCGHGPHAAMRVPAPTWPIRLPVIRLA